MPSKSLPAVFCCAAMMSSAPAGATLIDLPFLPGYTAFVSASVANPSDGPAISEVGTVGPVAIQGSDATAKPSSVSVSATAFAPAVKIGPGANDYAGVIANANADLTYYLRARGPFGGIAEVSVSGTVSFDYSVDPDEKGNGYGSQQSLQIGCVGADICTLLPSYNFYGVAGPTIEGSDPGTLDDPDFVETIKIGANLTYAVHLSAFAWAQSWDKEGTATAFVDPVFTLLSGFSDYSLEISPGIGAPVVDVPTAGTLPLFASGLAGLGLVYWRRRRKQVAT